MAIIRACSYSATIKLPEDPANYSKILVTFQQNGTNILEKDQSEVTIDSENTAVIVKLTQEETKLFSAGEIVVPLNQGETGVYWSSGFVFLQIRCYKSAYEAPGSKIWKVQVYPALNDEVLT